MQPSDQFVSDKVNTTKDAKRFKNMKGSDKNDITDGDLVNSTINDINNGDLANSDIDMDVFTKRRVSCNSNKVLLNKDNNEVLKIMRFIADNAILDDSTSEMNSSSVTTESTESEISKNNSSDLENTSIYHNNNQLFILMNLLDEEIRFIIKNRLILINPSEESLTNNNQMSILIKWIILLIKWMILPIKWILIICYHFWRSVRFF